MPAAGAAGVDVPALGRKLRRARRVWSILVARSRRAQVLAAGLELTPFVVLAVKEPGLQRPVLVVGAEHTDDHFVPGVVAHREFGRVGLAQPRLPTK